MQLPNGVAAPSPLREWQGKFSDVWGIAMTNGQSESKLDVPKSELELARYEMEYRRKKQWDIFAWVVTIFVAVIGGIVTLATNNGYAKIQLPQRLVIVLALGALATYAVLWVKANMDAEKCAISKIATLLHEDKTKCEFLKPPHEYSFGYPEAIKSMAVAAMLTVFVIDSAWFAAIGYPKVITSIAAAAMLAIFVIDWAVAAIWKRPTD